MDVKITVPEYDSSEGLKISWVDYHQIEVQVDGEVIEIRANAEGLLTLATQFLTLAQESVPTGRHIHLNDESGLSSGSRDLDIYKM